jgi:hypothetical protein
MCYQAHNKLNFNKKLENIGWDEESIQLVLSQIICRSVYPFSEKRTSCWIKENSAVCEIFYWILEVSISLTLLGFRTLEGLANKQ